MKLSRISLVFYRLAVCGSAAMAICLVLASAVAASPIDNAKTRNKALKALRAGDFEKAEKIYRDLLAKDEKDLDSRLGLSHALLKERRLQDSFDHAARAIAKSDAFRIHSIMPRGRLRAIRSQRRRTLCWDRSCSPREIFTCQLKSFARPSV